MIEHFFTASCRLRRYPPSTTDVVPPTPPSAGVGKFMEEKGTASLHPLPTPFQGWVASAYILSCAPLLVMGERATKWRGGIAKGMLPAAADIKKGL